MGRPSSSSRRPAAALIAIMALAGLGAPGGAGAADEASAITDDQVCALLSDAEIMAATGVDRIASMQPGPQFLLPAGCSWDLSPADGSMVRDLLLGVRQPGGRDAYEAEARVWAGAPRIAGIGEVGFQDLSGGWFAVADDSYLGMQYLAMGFGQNESAPPGQISRRALAWLAAARLAPPATRPGRPGPLCLLSIEELNEITGLAFGTLTGGDSNCAYDSETLDDPYTLDLGLEERDPTQRIGDDLVTARLSPGQEVTVGGFPAWQNPYMLTVDVGERLFVVRPIFLFSSSTPPPTDVMLPIAEMAIARLPAELMNPTPTATPDVDTDLEARFPSVDGTPLQVQTVTGDDLREQIERDPATQERFRSLEDALAPYGLGLQDVSLGSADRALAEGFLTIAAVRVEGADESLLLGEVFEWLTGGAAGISRTETLLAGVPVIELVMPGADDSDIGSRTRFAVATADVLWVLGATRCEQPNADPPPACALLGVDRDVLEEVVRQLD